MALTEELTEVMEHDEAEAARLYGVLKFIDWVMPLREELEDKFYNEYPARQQKEGIRFVPYAERKGRAEGFVEGHAKGRAESIIDLLTRRFGQLPATLTEAILRSTDATTLERLFAAAATCSTLDEFEQARSRSCCRATP